MWLEIYSYFDNLASANVNPSESLIHVGFLAYLPYLSTIVVELMTGPSPGP